LRIVERESEESAREVLPRVRARGEVEEEDPVLRDAIEKTSSLPPKPNSLPPQLDRFVPLSDHITDNCRMDDIAAKSKKSFRYIQNTKVFPEDFNLYQHSACRLTENFLPFLQIFGKNV
jgi:hypothetical protein